VLCAISPHYKHTPDPGPLYLLLPDTNIHTACP
jgi:hypothetical protein